MLNELSKVNLTGMRPLPPSSSNVLAFAFGEASVELALLDLSNDAKCGLLKLDKEV